MILEDATNPAGPSVGLVATGHWEVLGGWQVLLSQGVSGSPPPSAPSSPGLTSACIREVAKLGTRLGVCKGVSPEAWERQPEV